MADDVEKSPVRRVVEGVSLTVLFFVSFDMATTIFWLVGAWFFVGAARAFLLELGTARRGPTLMACAVSLVMFPAACTNCQQAEGNAQARVRSIGTLAQEACVRSNRCPTEAEVCGPEGCGSAGSAGVRFPIRYRVDDDGRTFSVSARLNIDEGVSVSGGTAESL